MPTTINTQNALQIREQPMDVYIYMLAGVSATIQTYSAANYKSYDASLDETAWSMRDITDLAGIGFPLDGSCQWYDSSLSPSAEDGKLGARGTSGGTLDVSITSTDTLTAITVSTRKTGTITVGADTYTATGLDVIPLNASSATLSFTPDDANGRAEVDYIIPGAEFSITNDNLISCTLALRGNLSVRDHTWEESEIEVKMYYPNDIGQAFAYISNEFPITYRAGYDSDLSDERKFYLSEPITQSDGVITIKGVDASHLLNDKSFYEQWFSTKTGNSHQTLYNKFIDSIQSAGITLKRKQSWSGSSSGVAQHAVIPEMTARTFVEEVMNLTLNHKRGGTNYGIQFVDAGIPTVEHGNGKTYGSTWVINKSDCGEWEETYEQNINAIIDTDDEHKFAETLTPSNASPERWPILETVDKPYVNQVIDLSYDSFYMGGASQATGGMLNWTTESITPPRPSGGTYKIKSVTYTGSNWGYQIKGRPVTITGGVKKYSNPNGLAGVAYEREPFVYGNITDGTDPIFNYKSLFNRSIRTGKFTWKGDPRMQPLDYINITNDTGDGRGNIAARVTNIELTHEAGGTIANIEWREWS